MANKKFVLSKFPTAVAKWTTGEGRKHWIIIVPPQEPAGDYLGEWLGSAVDRESSGWAKAARNIKEGRVRS